jgi:enoyl-CoA hydratase/carnithine racemase
MENQVMIINLPVIANYHTKIRQLADELSDVCTAVSSEKEVRAVIINWEQDEFSAGTDLAGFGSVKGEYETTPLSLTAAVAKLDRYTDCIRDILFWNASYSDRHDPLGRRNPTAVTLGG